MTLTRGRTPARSANARTRSASAYPSSGESFTPASGVTAHIGASPVVRACTTAASRTASSEWARSIGIRLRLTSVRALPIEIARRTRGASFASRRIPLGSPEVQTVTARASIASALGSDMTAIASSTRSRFAIGSPIPWKTTPCTRLRPAAVSARLTTRTCSTISHVSMFRCSPRRPVAQKAHASAHPACELTQTENRPAFSSGMRTVSTTFPPVSITYFTNGSTRLACSATTRTVGTELRAQRGPPGASRAGRRPIGASGLSRCTALTSFRASPSSHSSSTRESASGVIALQRDRVGRAPAS